MFCELCNIVWMRGYSPAINLPLSSLHMSNLTEVTLSIHLSTSSLICNCEITHSANIQRPWSGPVTSEKSQVWTSLSKSSQRRGRQAEQMILNRMRVASLELRERSCYVTLQETAFEISSRWMSFYWRVCNLHEVLKSCYYLLFPNHQTWSSSGVRDALWLKREAVILDILHSSSSGHTLYKLPTYHTLSFLRGSQWTSHWSREELRLKPSVRWMM